MCPGLTVVPVWAGVFIHETIMLMISSEPLSDGTTRALPEDVFAKMVEGVEYQSHGYVFRKHENKLFVRRLETYEFLPL